MQIAVRLAALVAALTVFPAVDAFSCWTGPRHPLILVAESEAIVRVRVMGEFEREVVSFRVLEQLKGAPLFVISVRGRMLSRPDLSWRPVPTGLTRREDKNRCGYGLTYQRDGEYLLLLGTVDGVLTPYWSLGVTNEQLLGPDDPWLEWVRQEAARPVKMTAPPVLWNRRAQKQFFKFDR